MSHFGPQWAILDLRVRPYMQCFALNSKKPQMVWIPSLRSLNNKNNVPRTMWKHPLTGHWRATERILGNFLWKILCKNLDLKGGGTGAGEGTLPMYLPPLRSNFLYRIFHKKFPRIRPVAFQWPDKGILPNCSRNFFLKHLGLDEGITSCELNHWIPRQKLPI